MGLPQLGRTVMDDGLAQSATPRCATRPRVPQFARRRRGRAGRARAGRRRAPFDGMRALARSSMRKVRWPTHAARSRAATARRLPRRSRKRRCAGRSDMLAAIGAQWIDAGEPDRGRTVARLDRRAPRDADADVRLRYGDLLGSAGRDDALAAWLDTLRREPSLTPDRRRGSRTSRCGSWQTDDAIAQQDYAQARKRLDRAGRPRGPALCARTGRSRTCARPLRCGARALAPAVARTPDDADTQLALARIDEDSGNRAAALARAGGAGPHAGRRRRHATVGRASPECAAPSGRSRAGDDRLRAAYPSRRT